MCCSPAACADCDPVVLERRRDPRNLPVGTYPRCPGCAEREERLLAGVFLIPLETRIAEARSFGRSVF
jgi:hypothetical protein